MLSQSNFIIFRPRGWMYFRLPLATVTWERPSTPNPLLTPHSYIFNHLTIATWQVHSAMMIKASNHLTNIAMALLKHCKSNEAFRQEYYETYKFAIFLICIQTTVNLHWIAPWVAAMAEHQMEFLLIRGDGIPGLLATRQHFGVWKKEFFHGRGIQQNIHLGKEVKR